MSQSETEPRGRREAPKTDGVALPVDPPVSLVGDLERVCWSRIRGALVRSAYAQAVDVEAVALAARRMARVEMFAGMVANLRPDQVTTTGGNGQIRIHPAFAELQKAENALNQSLGALLLTPRSRSSARLAGTGPGGMTQLPPGSTPAGEKPAHPLLDD